MVLGRTSEGSNARLQMYSVDEPWCSSKLIACNATLYDRKTGDAYLEWFVGPTFGEDKSLSLFHHEVHSTRLERSYTVACYPFNRGSFGQSSA
jgi:hypothetical protein